MLALELFVHLRSPAFLLQIVGAWDSRSNHNVIVRLIVLAENFVSEWLVLQLLVKVERCLHRLHIFPCLQFYGLDWRCANLFEL